MPLATAESYSEMLATARKQGFALPGVAVTSSETLNAALRGFADAESDGIVQVSPTAAKFASGTAVGSMVKGALALAAYVEAVSSEYAVQIALHTDHCRQPLLDTFLVPLLNESMRSRAKRGRPIFNSQMFDGSDLPIGENLDISARLLELTAAADVVLEIEVGVVGDAASRSATFDGSALTQPEHFIEVVERLGSGERGQYILAPGFGNVHGIATDVEQRIDIEVLRRGQEALQRTLGLRDPLYLAFHGGSGCSKEVIRESIRHGVVKFNVDSDTQYAFSRAIAGYVHQNYQPMTGADDIRPLKSVFDTRTYLRDAEIAMAEQVRSVCESVRSAGRSIGRG
jgi:fructose-bisphosphate aldolase, class II